MDDTKAEDATRLACESAHVLSETVRHRFLFEACATAQFQHPNIVVLHDVGEHQ